MLSPTIKKVIADLKKNNLATEDRTALTAALLETLNVVPIADVLTFNEEGMAVIRGKTLGPEQMIALKESALGLKDSYIKNLINDQVTYEAIKVGIHNGLSTDQIMFSKAALWVIQEEKKLITSILGK